MKSSRWAATTTGKPRNSAASKCGWKIVRRCWCCSATIWALVSTTIAQIYRERWRIEVFFRYLKQNLRIKTFVGTSANALHIQIWTALIAMLLLKYLQLRARYGWSLSNLVALLRQQLFVYRDLQAWLDTPFEAPPALAGLHDGQLALQFQLAV